MRGVELLSLVGAKPFRLLAIVCFFVLLGGCESENVPTSPPQTWNGFTIAIESRPPQVAAGMNEFLVIANQGQKPAHDLVVSLRVGDEGRWTQAIQDGHVGVYRRAVIVGDPSKDVLTVHLRRGSEEGVLTFPLQYAAVPPKH